MGKLSPLPSPDIKDGKMERFSFCTASSLIWGGGGGMVERGLLFHFILSKIVAIEAPSGHVAPLFTYFTS